ncbi:hypothetical protein V1512DRAFT_262804 [Lipomyces arxii]|uniref:uncharacterized protein n=1 Tax=Lipomyces arxii TaxID=56418 RepID=UPI0034CE0630
MTRQESRTPETYSDFLQYYETYLPPKRQKGRWIDSENGERTVWVPDRSSLTLQSSTASNDGNDRLFSNALHDNDSSQISLTTKNSEPINITLPAYELYKLGTNKNSGKVISVDQSLQAHSDAKCEAYTNLNIEAPKSTSALISSYSSTFRVEPFNGDNSVCRSENKNKDFLDLQQVRSKIDNANKETYETYHQTLYDLNSKLLKLDVASHNVRRSSIGPDSRRARIIRESLSSPDRASQYAQCRASSNSCQKRVFNAIAPPKLWKKRFR